VEGEKTRKRKKAKKSKNKTRTHDHFPVGRPLPPPNTSYPSFPPAPLYKPAKPLPGSLVLDQGRGIPPLLTSSSPSTWKGACTALLSSSFTPLGFPTQVRVYSLLGSNCWLFFVGLNTRKCCCVLTPVPAHHPQPPLLLAKSSSMKCFMEKRSPRRQSTSRFLVRNEATIMRARLGMYLVFRSQGIATLTIRKPVWPVQKARK